MSIIERLWGLVYSYIPQLELQSVFSRAHIIFGAINAQKNRKTKWECRKNLEMKIAVSSLIGSALLCVYASVCASECVNNRLEIMFLLK